MMKTLNWIGRLASIKPSSVEPSKLSNIGRARAHQFSEPSRQVRSGWQAARRCSARPWPSRARVETSKAKCGQMCKHADI